MADYTPIGDGELIADQPITQALMTRLRDNPIAIIERAAGAPTYGWTVVNTGSNANGSYRIWDDLFIQQWGRIAPANASTYTVPLPVTMGTTGYHVLLTRYHLNDTGGGTDSVLVSDARLSELVISTVVNPVAEVYWLIQGY